VSFDASDVAVVIPTQNRWDVLERTITALRAQSAIGFQIVVVVDKGAELPEFMAGVDVVHRNRRGVGAARNDGVKATDRPLIVFLGDDTIPEPDFMERHLAMHRRYPEIEVGVLGAVHWHPEVGRGRYQQWLDWSGTQFEYHTIVGDEAGWGRLYTSNVSLKRELYLKVGGFDEEFQFGYEDIELGLRLHNAGFRLLSEPNARVAHVHRYEWPAIERRFRLVGGGEYLMVRKHPDFPPRGRGWSTTCRPGSAGCAGRSKSAPTVGTPNDWRRRSSPDGLPRKSSKRSTFRSTGTTTLRRACLPNSGGSATCCPSYPEERRSWPSAAPTRSDASSLLPDFASRSPHQTTI
jgi:hypothetical protein